MKKEFEATLDEEMLPEYDFSGGVRGKYASRYEEGSNIVILSPDVAKVFTTSEAGNEALRAYAKIAKETASRTTG